MGINFTDFTGATALTMVELNRRFYQLDGVIEDQKDGNYYGASSELTITAGGAITVTGGYHTVAANGAPVVDDLDTINGTVEGQVITIAAASGDTITLRHGVGNIATMTGGPISMSGNQQLMLLDNGTNLVVLNSIAGGLLNEQVAHTTFVAPVANIDLTSIPATDNTLMLVMGLRSDQVANRDGIDITFNADAGANYTALQFERNVTTNVFTERLSQNELRITNGAAGASATANFVGVYILTIYNYASATKPRHLQYQGYVQHAVTTGNIFINVGGGLWNNAAAALDQITITPENGANWDEGFYALYSF